MIIDLLGLEIGEADLREFVGKLSVLMRETLEKSIDALVEKKMAAAAEGLAADIMQQRLKWRTLKELEDEFRVPGRTIRQWVDERKITKSEGLDPRVRYLRQDLVEMLEERQVKSARTLQRERNSSTPQCSNGTSLSRPFPARPVKMMESAGHSKQERERPVPLESRAQLAPSSERGMHAAGRAAGEREMDAAPPWGTDF
jgi:hypothetical protein